jgi:hypothetical protein
MTATSATTLTLRIDPAVKEGLRAVAALEHRSLANMIEVMIRDHCGRNGVTIPDLSTQSVDQQKPAAGDN